MDSKVRTRGFEVVSKYESSDINLPIRKTRFSAGYDVESAETVVIPSIWRQVFGMLSNSILNGDTNEEHKKRIIKPTLVPTGVKTYMENDVFAGAVNRSSNPLKKGLILSNGKGIIDSDYYNNPDNEGHFFFQFINFFPFDVTIKKGEAIGQIIFQRYLLADNDKTTGVRVGGHGSTDGLGAPQHMHRNYGN